MILGSMSLPDELKDKDFDWFKRYYDLTIKGKIEETAEEVYKLLGGKLPDKAEKAKKIAEA
jgi:hypothetical protein